VPRSYSPPPPTGAAKAARANVAPLAASWAREVDRIRESALARRRLERDG
jgi:hypothetical protein